ncbi:MAG: hypothetical protein ACFBSE_02105 [Prochloraceae cyanobacterium]
MSKFNPSKEEDRHLVAFLQQYRPVPPPGSANTEAELMAIIEREEKRRYSLKIKPIIAIASTAIIGGIFSFVSYRLSAPSYTNAQLESFMVNNWDGTFGETYSEDLFLLSDREIDADSAN